MERDVSRALIRGRIAGLAGLVATMMLSLSLGNQLPAQAPPAVDCRKLKEPVDHATMDHAAHQALLAACAGPATTSPPSEVGQGAFAALAEIVRILEADPTTDWSKVNLGALREHLRDMDDVTLNAEIRQVPIPGGVRAEATGQGRTVEAIRRMLVNHAGAENGQGDVVATAAEIPGGAAVTLTARDPGDARQVARVRGLGLIGWLTLGSHHQPHHLAIARGDAAGHRH